MGVYKLFCAFGCIHGVLVHWLVLIVFRVAADDFSSVANFVPSPIFLCLFL